jgi:hypothetical protein
VNLVKDSSGYNIGKILPQLLRIGGVIENADATGDGLMIFLDTGFKFATDESNYVSSTFINAFNNNGAVNSKGYGISLASSVKPGAFYSPAM